MSVTQLASLDSLHEMGSEHVLNFSCASLLPCPGASGALVAF